MIPLSGGGNSSFERRRFRRSRPRVFAKGLARVLLPGFLLSPVLVCGLTAYFVYSRNLPWWVVIWAVVPALALGCVIPVLEAGLALIRGRMVNSWGRLLGGFVLFFLHVISYFLVSSLLITSAVGWFFQVSGIGSEMVGDYGSLSATVFFLFGVASWARNMLGNEGRRASA